MSETEQRARPAPRATVVIPAGRAAPELPRVLAALERQTAGDFEAVVVHSAGDAEIERALDGRDVRVLRPRRPLMPHEARNLAVEETDGELVVFLDADCVPRPDWLERILERFDRGAPVIGGSFDVAHGDRVERGANVAKFTPWLTGEPEGEPHALPSANLAIARGAWQRAGGFILASPSSEDTELVWRYRVHGFQPVFVPTAVVAHHDRPPFGRFLSERVERGRAYALTRSSQHNWGKPKALAYSLAAPAFALKLIFRGVRASVRSLGARRTIGALPVFICGYLAWSAGEARGYARYVLD